MNHRIVKDIIYYIIYCLFFIAIVTGSGIALAFERFTISLPIQALIVAALLIAAFVLYAIVRYGSVSGAVSRHKRPQTVQKVKKRHSLFVREILPALIIYLLAVGTIAIYYVWFYKAGEASLFFPGKTISHASIWQLYKPDQGLSVGFLYAYSLDFSCSLFGYCENAMLFLNAAFKVIAIMGMYGFIRIVHNRSGAIISCILMMLIPFYYLRVGYADEMYVTIAILMVWLFITALISQGQHIASRKAGFILFVIWGILSGGFIAFNIGFAWLYLLGICLLSFHSDGSVWKISGKCILMYTIGFVLASGVIYFLVGVPIHYVIPRILPYPELFCGISHYHFIFVLLSGLPIILQKGNTLESISYLSVLNSGALILCLFEFMPGSQALLILLVCCMSVGIGISMIFTMGFPTIVKASDIHKETDPDKASKMLIESLTGMKIKNKTTQKSEADYPMGLSDSSADYDIQVNESDDYDL